MAAEDGGGRQSRTTVAVIVVLCSLAQSLTCFSLRGLSNEKKDEVSEATVMEVRDGSILFNGKKLDSQSGSASAATGTEEMLTIDLDYSGNTELLGQTSELEKATANEAAWRRMKPSLHCGHSKMTFKAMGPGATYLQLDMGNAHLLPLNQVPETCSYSMKQNLLGLVLVVPYEGCNVIQEDGNYVLSMSWLETPVKLTCPVLKNYAATSSTTNPAQQPWKFPFPHSPWNLNRHKRQANQPFLYDIRHYYPYLNNYNYYMNMMTPAPASAAATTTAKPDMTTTTSTMTTKSSTSPMAPPANQNLYLYYLYLYSLYYPYYYYPLPNVPMITQPPTTTTTTTATPTSGPATSGMTTTPKMTTTSSGSTTTAPGSTTTASPVTTKAPQIPLFPYYPPYFPFPYYPPAGQQFPGNADMNYYQIIQHYYGKPPYPQIPPPFMQATQPPTTTTKPGESTTTAKTDASTPTAKPSDTSTTMKPTTVSPPTTTCDKNVCPTKPSGDYPGPLSPYVPYYQLPFIPYVSYKYNKAGKLADDQKYMPQVDYKSGPQARAHPPPHPGFHYWQPVPWFPQSSGHENLKFAWKQSTA